MNVIVDLLVRRYAYQFNGDGNQLKNMSIEIAREIGELIATNLGKDAHGIVPNKVRFMCTHDPEAELLERRAVAAYVASQKNRGNLVASWDQLTTSNKYHWRAVVTAVTEIK